MGNPAPASYVPASLVGLSDRMNFWERLENFIFGLTEEVIYRFKTLPDMDKVMRKYFGDDLPPIQDILRNTSLVLVNHHYSLGFPRPYLPNMVEIGGYHVPPPKPLPKVSWSMQVLRQHNVPSLLFPFPSFFYRDLASCQPMAS